VRVRQQDVTDIDIEIADRRQQIVDLVAGVDDDRFACPLASDDEPVLVERRYRPNL
jgi:hypothetical protein